MWCVGVCVCVVCGVCVWCCGVWGVFCVCVCVVCGYGEMLVNVAVYVITG